MKRFADEMAVLRDKMTWDSPEFVVGRIAATLVDAGINNHCRVCLAEPGEMCVTPTGRDRSVTHTERNEASCSS